MHNKTISNLLILTSGIVTAISFFLPSVLDYGMHPLFWMQGDYLGIVLQFLLYQFLHGGILHFVMNSFFLFIFGNQVEVLIGRQKYILFFLGNTLFVGIALLLFASANTIGISGFAMAILAYIALELKSRNNPEYRSAMIFLFINVVIGLTGNISLVGHLSGAIFGAVFFFFHHKKTQLY
ncbi:MAG: rhomboid family intramembrane serine protease [Candidatus Gracilibacteria bacterium]|nr:rhomboid family intramembrane serine protease [Candidatus Gracilibacteria bacterium]